MMTPRPTSVAAELHPHYQPRPGSSRSVTTMPILKVGSSMFLADVGASTR